MNLRFYSLYYPDERDLNARVGNRNLDQIAERFGETMVNNNGNSLLMRANSTT